MPPVRHEGPFAPRAMPPLDEAAGQAALSFCRAMPPFILAAFGSSEVCRSFFMTLDGRCRLFMLSLVPWFTSFPFADGTNRRFSPSDAALTNLEGDTATR